MRVMKTIISGLFVLGAFGLFSATAVHAKGKLQLKTAVIYATKTGKMDSNIKKEMQKSLSATFGAYKGFKLINKGNQPLSKATPATIKLPTKQKALISLIGKKGKAYQLKLSIPKDKVKVKLSAPPKKLFYQAGIPYKKGRLILAFYLKE